MLAIPQILAWVQAGQLLVSTGVATIQTIRTWIKGQHGAMSDADLDAICDAVASGAARHKALAQADAGA